MEEPGEQEQALKGLGVAPGHAWLSQGMTNLWANLFLKELKARVKYRINGNYFSKVYAWTVDKQKTALKYLNIGLDGIIANYPVELIKRSHSLMRTNVSTRKSSSQHWMIIHSESIVKNPFLKNNISRNATCGIKEIVLILSFIVQIFAELFWCAREKMVCKIPI